MDISDLNSDADISWTPKGEVFGGAYVSFPVTIDYDIDIEKFINRIKYKTVDIFLYDNGVIICEGTIYKLRFPFNILRRLKWI